MNNLKYDYWKLNERYLFYSVGENGRFLKSVRFVQYGNMNLFEIILEDYIEKLDFYSLNTVTNNYDIEKYILQYLKY